MGLSCSDSDIMDTIYEKAVRQNKSIIAVYICMLVSSIHRVSAW